MIRRRMVRAARWTTLVGVALISVTVLAAPRDLDGGTREVADAAAVTTAPPTGPSTGLVALDPAAADALVERWRRSLEATYVAEGRFQRVTEAGSPLDGPTYLAQRPPDRVEAGLGSLDAVLGGQRLACGVDDTGASRCRGVPNEVTQSERVEEAIGRLRSLLVDDPGADVVAPYRVAVDPQGCFVLTLRFVLPAPPYGESATFCFDPATGARAATEIRRERGVVDRHRVHTLRSVVTDEDLVRPAEADLAPLLGEGRVAPPT